MRKRRYALELGAAAGALAAGAAFVQRRHMRQVASDPERATLDAPLSGRPLSATSADGTQLHIELFGNARGPTLVLAHGWTEEIRVWVYVISELSDDFRIVAYNLRGHGRSARAASGDYALARFGEDLEAVLEATLSEGETAVVAGHSLGGMSIAAWAEENDIRARASGAALLFTGLDGLIGGQLVVHIPRIFEALNEPVARHFFLGSRAPLPRFSTPISAAAIRYFAFGPHATHAQVAAYERMLVTTSPAVRAASGIAMSEMDLRDALPRLTVPTLVMAGADDRLTPPAHSKRIAEALPNLYKLIELPGTGHMGPLERPHEISQALRELTNATQPQGTGGAAARQRSRKAQL